MVTKGQRRLLIVLIRLHLIKIHINHYKQIVYIDTHLGTRRIINWIKRTQPVDDLHHAPMCPANHYHRQQLTFRACTCGAA